MSPVALLLVLCLVGAVGLLRMELQRICFIFSFLLRALLSEIKEHGIWNWRGLLHRQGSIRVSDLKLCKKVLTHPAWPDHVRTSSVIHMASFGKPIGLIFGCGENFKAARRISERTLTRIGFHQSFQLEQAVSPQVTSLLSTLGELVDLGKSTNKDMGEGALWCPKRKLHPYAVAIMWNILFGRKLPKDDVTIEKFLGHLDDTNRKFGIRLLFWNHGNNIISKLLSSCLQAWAWYKASITLYGPFKELISNRRRQDPDALQGSNNFLDAYLINVDGDRTDEALLVILRDLLSGAGETVGSTLEFAILQISLNHSVQERIQDEIDRSVGPSRRPLYGDRKSMPYTQATILESLRLGSLLSPGERIAQEDNTIDGVFYPKGTVVAIRNFEIHESKDLWEDPQNFRPERFLSADGTRVENKGKIIPFGYGPRMCIGESLGQVALFMFLTAMVQEFSFHIPKELPPSPNEKLRGRARSPAPYFVRLIRRDSSYCYKPEPLNRAEEPHLKETQGGKAY